MLDASAEGAYLGFNIKYSEVPDVLIRAYVSGSIAAGSDTHTGVKFGGLVITSADTTIQAGEWFRVVNPLSQYAVSHNKGNCYCALGSNAKHAVEPFAASALTGFQFQIDDSAKTAANDLTVSFKDIDIYN